ncbi:P-loop containing nucleoside triphosphate hydrolase protein [Stachybotrys elegans]|uniref:P-loop containing nucleoside triphosphate hydrolase protein n=1 Tax=Stachybotrys elegans TaxID=80388 RepID=A0A8K0SDK9_9HYPO|nr:P-loop containing nucleoside triphosphate hydrolase protein [Stachybotrys elegans]
MVRGSLISLIFKSTYYSSASQVHSTESLTLMTVDVDKVMFGFEDLHELWANVLQIAVAVYVLASQMSWASVAPVLVPICLSFSAPRWRRIVCVAATIPAATRIGVAQKDWNQKVQERVDVTASVLSGLREIRMLGIGGVAAGIIQQLRVDETRKSHRFRQLMTAIITLFLAPLITFALYTVVQNITGELSFSAAQAFTTLSLVNLISGPVSVLVQSFPGFASGISSLARIQDYVIATRSTTCGNPDILPHSPLPPVDEKGSRLLGSSLTALTPSDGSTAEELHVVVKEGTFGWREDAKVLNNINFKIAQGSLTLVTGPVGAGKSTLLWGILGELPFSRGHIWKQKSQTSFCPQTPWLVSGSIRHNIVCGTKYEKEWYDQVIAACSLVEDLRNIDNGDQHEVGNEGRNLSGGQRQRVALARAVYARSPLVILDEPLSGVDIKSAKHIVTALFGPGGLLRSGNTTVIIVVIVQPDGSLQKVEELDSTACDTTLNPAVAKQDSGSQGTHGLPASSQPDPNVQRAQEQAELQRKRGDWGIYLFYLQATGYLNAGAFLFFCLACAFLSQFSVLWVRWWADAAATVPSEQVSTGYYLGIYALLCVLAIVGLAVAAWMLMVRMVTRTATDLHGRVLRTLFLAPTSHFSTIDNGITLNRFNQDMQLLDFHLPLAGVNTFLFACICLVQAVVICTSVSFMAVAIPFCLAVLYFIQSFYLQTSRQLRLLDIEAKAPLFTNFKEAIDGLPSIRAYGHSFGSFLENDNRDLLDASQQPIYLLYTVQRWLSLVLDLVVAGLAVLLIVLAIYVDAGTTGSDMGVALVSLMSFNQYLTHLVRYWASLETSLGTISRIKEFILSTPKADGSLGSPQSSHVSAEEVAGSAQEIIFKNATATYKKNTSGTQMDGEGAETSLGIDSIGLVIPPCTKLAITGRSGSGKSTLVSALFRILPVTSGSISIGGQDISQIDQEIIQRRMNAVTQSPYFLPGLSIRESLDPISRMELLASSKPSGGEAESQEMSLIKDTILQEILEKLRLWPTVEERGGLDAQLLPSSWSSGQLQLLSLARAIVKARNLRSHPGTGWRILVLDEATSGIESEFAALMRETIRQEFADHTILAIVHGFDDVMEDMDQMIVMDSGRISAQGPPGEILRQEYSQ